MSVKSKLAEKLILFGAFIVFAGLVVAFALSQMPKEKPDREDNTSRFQYKTASKPAYSENASNSSVKNGALVNINTDDKEKLMTLPGIGEKKAQAIIDYRTENGPFNKIEDLLEISGIGEATLNKLKDLVTVE